MVFRFAVGIAFFAVSATGCELFAHLEPAREEVMATDASDGGGSDANDGGGSDANDAATEMGDAPSGDEVQTITVHGTVIGDWRHRVPGADVYLGDRATKTDANGEFTFSGVTPPYDVTLAFQKPWPTAWSFKGLTRPDPTLELYDVLLPAKGGALNLLYGTLPAGPTNDGGPVPRTLSFAFGSLDGTFAERAFDLSRDEYDFSFASWYGPDSTAGTLHALLWETTGGVYALPNHYVSYASTPVALTTSQQVVASMSLPGNVLPEDDVAGTIDRPSVDTELDGYLRFDSGAVMPIFMAQQVATTFSVLMPIIPHASVAISARWDEPGGSGEQSAARKEGLVPGDVPVQLSLPSPPTLVSPDDQAQVAASAPFEWLAPPQVVVLVVKCNGGKMTDLPTYIYVVTQDKKAVLPSLPASSGVVLPTNRLCTWWVEVYGVYAAVDEATGPAGMLEPMFGLATRPVRASGTATKTRTRYVNFAP